MVVDCDKSNQSNIDNVVVTESGWQCVEVCIRFIVKCKKMLPVGLHDHLFLGKEFLILSFKVYTGAYLSGILYIWKSIYIILFTFLLNS